MKLKPKRQAIIFSGILVVVLAVIATTIFSTASPVKRQSNSATVKQTSTKKHVSASMQHCKGSNLELKVSHQGENGGVNAVLTITNTEGNSCALESLTQVKIISVKTGNVLAQSFDNLNSKRRISLRHNQSVFAIIYWANWCKANPGPLNIVVNLSHEALTGSFDEPPGYPGYDYLPICINSKTVSSIQIVQSFSVEK